jgi:HAE1 family hydrophobic/amphiphilic exporter-1
LVLSPFIGLQAFNINKLTSLPQSMTYGLLGGLSAPLFNQNQLRSQLAMQKALYGESFYKYEQTVLMAWQEANTLISGLQLYNQAVQMKYEEVHALRTAYGAAMDLFSAGRANYLEVINVQKNLLEAEINHLEMNYQRMQMRIQLYKAFGGGWTVQ